ncbi:MAG: cytochrome c oxidase subunit I, partial [Firmicutes bacterium]|nr:cytochrome c oxidase subunit I [Bacillota bacterium]
MSTPSQVAAHVHAPPQGFLRKYIFSTDHKVIGLQYYLLALVAVFVGLVLSLLMRWKLAWPNDPVPLFGDGPMLPEQYLALVTMHG